MESMMYIADSNGNRILAVNRTQMAVEAEIPVGIQPASVVEDPLRKLLFVLNAGSRNISIIDTEINEVKNTVEIESEATSMALDADREELILFHRPGYLSIIDTQQFNTKGRIEWLEEPKEGTQTALTDDQPAQLASPTLPLQDQIGDKSGGDLLAPSGLPALPEEDVLNPNEREMEKSLLPFPDLDMKPAEMPKLGMGPEGQWALPMMPQFPMPNIPGNFLSGGPSMLNPFGSLDQTSPNMMSPLSMDQFPNFATSSLQAGNTMNSSSRYIRSGSLNRLKIRVRNLGLPPKTARMLERNLDSAMKHLRFFVRNMRNLVKLNLLSERKAAPLIKEAQKIISMTSDSGNRKEAGFRLD